ncbi:MAG TPA: DUF1801 domain-containing protein [Thermoplasmata archaeon]|nr:DUF1801 domain-containing protein [Thermoplasmata archaeon]
MVAPRAPNAALDPLFRELPESYRAIAVALRAAVRAAAPTLAERVKWNNPFWVGASDVVCLQCYPDHVNLGFLRGAELARAHPELEGTGRAMRHLRVASVADARSERVRRLIRAAVALDRTARPRAARPGSDRK